MQDSPPNRPDFTYEPDVWGSHKCLLGRVHSFSGVVSIVTDGLTLLGGVFGGGGDGGGGGGGVSAVIVGVVVVVASSGSGVTGAAVAATLPSANPGPRTHCRAFCKLGSRGAGGPFLSVIAGAVPLLPLPATPFFWRISAGT